MKRKARRGKIRGGWVNLRREINQECNGSIYLFRNNVKNHAATFTPRHTSSMRLVATDFWNYFSIKIARRDIYCVFQPVPPRQGSSLAALGIIKPSAYCCRHGNVVIFLASRRPRRFPCNLTSSRRASVHSPEKELHIHVCIQISDSFSSPISFNLRLADGV